MLGGEYKRHSKEGASNESMVKNLERAGVRNGTSVSGAYSTYDPKKADPANPGASPEALAAKSVSFSGVYGEIADPEKTLDAYFAQMRLEADKDTDSKTKLIGSAEEVSPTASTAP